MRRLAPLIVVLVLAGCGSGDEVVATDSTVRIRIDEFRLRPQKVRVVGPNVKIVMPDTGRLTHNLKVFSTTETDEEDHPILLGGTSTAHPGETISAVVRLQPGTYRLACTIANHDDLGEHGKLIVVSRTGKAGGES
jgi:plastocyanin